MKAKRLLAIVLALAMILSSMLSVVVTVHAEDYTYIALNLCDLTCSKGFNNGGAQCNHTNTAAAGMSATFGVEPNQGLDNAAVLTATVPEGAESLSGVMSMCDNALANEWYGDDNYAEIYGVNAQGEALLATTAVVTADAPLAEFSVAVTGYTGIKIKVYNPSNLHTDHITFYNTQFAVPQLSGDAEAAAAVDALIEALPETVAATDRAVIKAARAAYDELTAAQKVLVTGLSKLEAAEAALLNVIDYLAFEAEEYNNGGNDKTSGDVGYVGDLKTGSASFTFTIYTAAAGERAFRARISQGDTRNLKVTVNGVETLFDCPNTGDWNGNVWGYGTATITLAEGENNITVGGGTHDWMPNIDKFEVEKLEGDSLEPTISEEDIQAAAAVDALIGAIFDPVVATDKATIKAARTAYDALNTAQKGLVEKLAVLEAAEVAIKDVLDYITIEAEDYVDANRDDLVTTDGDKVIISGFGWDNGANYVAYNFYAATAGERVIRLYCRNEWGGTRHNIISVNGVEQVTVNVDSNSTGFVARDAVITLEEGMNVIKMYTDQSSSYSAFGNMDKIEIENLGGDGLEAPVVDHEFAVTNSDAAVTQNGEKFDITWNANVVLDEGVELAALNGKVTFTEYGVIYGTSADEVAKIVAGEATNNAKIKAFDKIEGEETDIDVYTIFGFRLKGVAADKTRAAQFYVTYELNGKSYTVYSECVDATAEIAQ